MTVPRSAKTGFTADDMLRVEAGASKTSSTVPRETDVNRNLLKLAEMMGGLDHRPPISPVVLSGVVRLTDFSLLIATGFATHLAFGAADRSFFLAYVFGIPTIAAAATALSQLSRLFSLAALRNPIGSFFHLAIRWAVLLALVLGGLGAVRPDHALTQWWMLAWLGIGLAALAVERCIAWGVVRSLTAQGRLERRTVIVGGGKSGEDLLDALQAHPDTDMKIYGVFDDRNDARSPDLVSGYPKLGTVSDLVTFARKTRIDLVIFTLPITAEERLLQMLRKLWVLPIDIRLAAHRNKLRFRPRSYSYIGDVPVLDVFDKPIADWDIVIKAVFDRLVGALALIALSPVLLVTALAVKLDSKGPVLFRQKRHGFNNELIEVYKFRSLFADQADHLAAKQVTKDDPRVTRVGRFIRKTSLDELPQLFNVVFKGDLSLVGPRPHAVHALMANRAYEEVVDGYFARHRVKPGITGWAQINGWRGETDTSVKIQKRVEHDLAYIENWSILFDLYILLKTPFALTRTENAY